MCTQGLMVPSLLETLFAIVVGPSPSSWPLQTPIWVILSHWHCHVLWCCSLVIVIEHPLDCFVFLECVLS